LIDKDIEKAILGQIYELFFEQIEIKKNIPYIYLNFSRFSLNTEKLLKKLSSNVNKLDFFRVLKNLEREKLLHKTQENYDNRQYLSMTLKGYISIEQKFKDNSGNLQELIHNLLKIIAEKEEEDKNNISVLKIPLGHFFTTLNLEDNSKNRNKIICLVNELTKNGYFFRKESPYIAHNLLEDDVDSFYFSKKDYLVLENKSRKLILSKGRKKASKNKTSRETVKNEIERSALRKKPKKLTQQLKNLIFRASIWRAYNRKCLYCGDLISRLENMEGDHIIPKIYKNRPREFEILKEDYELQSDFDIEAYYNRAPSHKGCNVKKLEHLYEKAATLFYIEEAKLKIPKIKEYERKFKDNISISDGMLEGEINVEKLDFFFKKMGVSIEQDTIQIEDINERALQEHINSFNNHLDIIREKGSEAFEWRYYKIREEARKVFDYREKNDFDLPVIDNLIKLLDLLINEDDKELQYWGIDILDLLSYSPTLINSIKEKCYERLKLLYKPDIVNDQLVDLLDKCGFFPDDTIPEIIELIKKQYVKSLNCFKHRLYNKKFTISREKAQSYIDEITVAIINLEPKTNQSHSAIKQYANEVMDLINKIE